MTTFLDVNVLRSWGRRTVGRLSFASIALVTAALDCSNDSLSTPPGLVSDIYKPPFCICECRGGTAHGRLDSDSDGTEIAGVQVLMDRGGHMVQVQRRRKREAKSLGIRAHP